MKIFGIAGHSGMGKTTLLERLVPEISSQDLFVSLIKHSHKNIDSDDHCLRSYDWKRCVAGSRFSTFQSFDFDWTLLWVDSFVLCVGGAQQGNCFPRR